MNNPSPHTALVLKEEVFKTVKVCFAGFEGLPARKGQSRTDSPEFTCFGHRWYVQIYPGGRDDSDDGHVALFLQHKSDENILNLRFCFLVKKSTGKAAAYCCCFKSDFPGSPAGGINGWGSRDFADRTALIGALQNGALVIEVQMQQTGSRPSESFVPENPLPAKILKSFMDEESSDLVFEVGGEQETSGRKKKRAKTSTTTFHAHKYIIRQCSSMLGDLCKQSDNVQINDVRPEIFRHLLYDMYGGKVPDDDMKANAKDIIDAADKYGIVNLKLKAEACFVDSTAITIGNMAENLLYADSKNCALLKEAVMDFVVENGFEVVEKVSFGDFPGHLMKDLLVAVNREKAGSNKAGGNGDEFGTMRVSDLRKRLHEKGLDVDGSRESMIAALKEDS